MRGLVFKGDLRSRIYPNVGGQASQPPASQPEWHSPTQKVTETAVASKTASTFTAIYRF